MSLPLPDYYEPEDTTRIYHERAGMVSASAGEYRRKHDLQPAGDDALRVAVFGIDCQIGFTHPEASLYVPGAEEDMQRAAEWIYRNVDKITKLHFSMDTHRVYQIFHPAFWTDDDGKHPDPFTTITHDDLRAGKWKPIAHPQLVQEYTQKLEESGKHVLTVWPYHTMLGGVSHALNPAIMEASIFHSVARESASHFETKGTHQLTENYSVLKPEVTELRGQRLVGFNAMFFEMLMDNDRVYIFGEASSHCVRETIRDILDAVREKDPALAERVYIVEDAMSPVAPPMADPPAHLDFPAIAEKAIEEFEAAGMNVVDTSHVIGE